MKCDVCGRPGTAVHGFTLCLGHGRDLIAEVLTTGCTPLHAFLNLDAHSSTDGGTTGKPSPVRTQVRSASTLPLDRHTYAVPVPGAKEQPAPSPVRARTYVNGFTHRATDPNRTWPTR